ncbi:hypothetical protein T01_8605 [Trichinella spiralis]|uniref:Uncharacterized protein n=1 Tax=Trichinella spiralis TaxID=6334 RepID=A0A0V1BZN7_TRISP|nr:hypothetical protein T01_8605 [Trichinella spiralis]
MQPISNYTKHRMKSRRYSKEHFIRRDGAAADLHDFFGTGLSARQNDQLRLAVKASKSSIFDVSAVKVSCLLYGNHAFVVAVPNTQKNTRRRMLMTIGRLKPFDNFYAVYFVCHLCKQASALSTQNGIFDHLVQHSLHTSVVQEFHSVVFLTTISFALFLKFISQFTGYYDPSSSETSVAWCLLPWCMLSQPYQNLLEKLYEIAMLVSNVTDFSSKQRIDHRLVVLGREITVRVDLTANSPEPHTSVRTPSGSNVPSTVAECYDVVVHDQLGLS